MDRRLLLGGGASSLRTCRLSDHRLPDCVRFGRPRFTATQRAARVLAAGGARSALPVGSRLNEESPCLGLLVASLALILLASLCGCDAGARQTARQRAGTASSRPPEKAPPADVPPVPEDPIDPKAKPAETAPGPAAVEPGTKLEYRLPDESAAAEEPKPAPPDGPLAPMTTPAPEPTVNIPKFTVPELDPGFAKSKAKLAVKSAAGDTKTRTKAPVDKGFSRVRVFYATDRQRGPDEPNEFYTDRRRDDESRPGFDLGYCEVSVPYKHAPGEIERPSVWKLEFRENPAKHLVLLNVQTVEPSQWQADVSADVNQSAEKAALVFVHGFSVDFASAARRTAQMKYDLNFQGAAILYSWPAPNNYLECEGNAIWTLPHLMEFLTEYVQKSGAVKIHLIAHSMGTRVLAMALKELAAYPAAAPIRYNQIILAAPDIDAAIFKQQIAPRILDAAERISIYSSSQDWALVASKKVNGYKRLGEGGENLTTFPQWPKIEVLDATNVDESLLGHSYYGDSPTILRDVRGVLAGVSAVARGLKAQADYYLFSTKRRSLSLQPK